MDACKSTHDLEVKNFAERLKLAMKLRDIGVNELDAALGRERYISNLIRRGSTPEAANIKLIAEALRVDYGWLFEGDGPAPKLGDGPPPDRHEVAPFLRLDPAWPVELEIARARLPQRIPVTYLESAGDAVVPGCAVSADLILRMAEVLWIMASSSAAPETAPSSRSTTDLPLVSAQPAPKKRAGSGSTG